MKIIMAEEKLDGQSKQYDNTIEETWLSNVVVDKTSVANYVHVGDRIRYKFRT